MSIVSQLGLVPGQYFEQNMLKANKLRVKKVEHRNTPAVRKRRKILHGQRTMMTSTRQKTAPHMKQDPCDISSRTVRPYENLDPIVLMINIFLKMPKIAISDIVRMISQEVLEGILMKFSGYIQQNYL